VGRGPFLSTGHGRPPEGGKRTDEQALPDLLEAQRFVPLP
jgi:hypothetical protein